MSFTKNKFLSLSKSNKIKKTIFAIKDLIEQRKDEDYPKTLLEWLKESENLDNDLPKNYYEWGILLNRLQSLIKLENEFIEDICYDDPKKERILFPIKLILNDIRSPFNVGAIFRTSEAFGVSEIILSGITPTPENNSKVLKTSKNSEIFYSFSDNIIDKIKNLKSQDFNIVSLEKTANSLPINETDLRYPLCLIVGNEEFGVQKELLELSDYIVHIKLFGKKNSINVGIATGIALNLITL